MTEQVFFITEKKGYSREQVDRYIDFLQKEYESLYQAHEEGSAVSQSLQQRNEGLERQLKDYAAEISNLRAVLSDLRDGATQRSAPAEYGYSVPRQKQSGPGHGYVPQTHVETPSFAYAQGYDRPSGGERAYPANESAAAGRVMDEARRAANDIINEANRTAGELYAERDEAIRAIQQTVMLAKDALRK